MLNWMQKGKRGPGRSTEVSGAMDGMLITGLSGLVTGTHVASNLGWRAVESLCAGDRVLTFDNGMRTVTSIQRETLWMPDVAAPGVHLPVFVPRGALYNRKDLWLMPEQGLLIESDAISDALGDPYAVVPAAALIGYRGICRRPPEVRLEMTVLSFFADEVVYVEGGMLAFCPRPRCILTDDPMPGEDLYDVLAMPAAKSLIEGLMAQDHTRAFTFAPEKVASVA